MKQSTVKNTYISIQNRLMSVAFLFIFLMSAIVMGLESYYMMQTEPQIAQIIIIMSIFLGIMCNMVAMLIVEVVFQEEIHEFPFVGYLARLTPELSITQRHAFLTSVFRRQLLTSVMLIGFWIMVGNTHRSAPIVVTMLLITTLSIFGIYHVRSLPVSSSSEIDEDSLLQ